MPVILIHVRPNQCFLITLKFQSLRKKRMTAKIIPEGAYLNVADAKAGSSVTTCLVTTKAPPPKQRDYE